VDDPCRNCGACCEGCDLYGVDPVDLLHVPAEFYGPGEDRHDPRRLGMFTVPTLRGRVVGGRRCGALAGTVGQDARCTLYPTATEPDRRPWVCGATPAGSRLCAITRERAGLPTLDAVPWPPPGWSFRIGWPPGQFQRAGIIFQGDADVWTAWIGQLSDDWPATNEGA